MRKSKFKLSNAFYDNRFVLVFSIVCAVVVWAVVMVQFGNEQEKQISNVPVIIDYSSVKSKYGLQPFGETDFTVNLTLSGKRYIIEKSNIADEIVVKATASKVTSTGTYKLKIEVSTLDPNPEFTITNMSRNEIEVFFDTYSEEVFKLEPVTAGKYGANLSDIAPEGYCVGAPSFGNGERIVLSGPDSQLSKVTAVQTIVTFDEQITDTQVLDGDINIVSKASTTFLNTDRVNLSEPVTFPVYKVVKGLNAEIKFSNKPRDYISAIPAAIDYDVSPAVADFGIRDNKVNEIEGDTVTIKTIDYQSLKNGVNTFTVTSGDLVDMMLVDPNIEFTVTVTVNMDSNVRAIDITQDNVEFIGLEEGKKAQVISSQLEVVVVGPTVSLSTLTADSVKISVDLSDKLASDSDITRPATVTLNGVDDCWIYVDEDNPYLVNFRIETD